MKISLTAIDAMRVAASATAFAAIAGAAVLVAAQFQTADSAPEMMSCHNPAAPPTVTATPTPPTFASPPSHVYHYPVAHPVPPPGIAPKHTYTPKRDPDVGRPIFIGRGHGCGPCGMG